MRVGVGVGHAGRPAPRDRDGATTGGTAPSAPPAPPWRGGARRPIAIGRGGIVLYNWWVAVVLHTHLLTTPDELFSDLEAVGRPDASLLQHLDLSAGIVLVAALLLRGRRGPFGPRAEWPWLVAFAASGAVGGHFAYVCPEGISAACRSAEWRLALPAHHYVHVLAGIVEFATATVAVYLAWQRTRPVERPTTRAIRWTGRTLVAAYPLLALAYLTDRLGAFVEPVFFVCFSVMVSSSWSSPSGRPPPAGAGAVPDGPGQPATARRGARRAGRGTGADTRSRPLADRCPGRVGEVGGTRPDGARGRADPPDHVVQLAPAPLGHRATGHVPPRGRPARTSGPRRRGPTVTRPLATRRSQCGCRGAPSRPPRRPGRTRLPVPREASTTSVRYCARHLLGDIDQRPAGSATSARLAVTRADTSSASSAAIGSSADLHMLNYCIGHCIGARSATRGGPTWTVREVRPRVPAPAGFPGRPRRHPGHHGFVTLSLIDTVAIGVSMWALVFINQRDHPGPPAPAGGVPGRLGRGAVLAPRPRHRPVVERDRRSVPRGVRRVRVRVARSATTRPGGRVPRWRWPSC